MVKYLPLLILVILVACSSKKVSAPPEDAGVSHVMGAGPSTPSSWTVPNWYIDGANSTGCATDRNNCQSATCLGGGVGPCTSFGTVINRWGTPSPTLTQVTRAAFLSDDSEQIFNLTPTVVAPNGKFIVTGTFTNVASGTLSGVIQKNRTTGQLLTATLAQTVTPYLRYVLWDTTQGTYSWIDSTSSGTTAVLTQPFSVLVDCPFGPSESDTVQSGDSYQILRPSKIPIGSWLPIERGDSSGLVAGTVCLENAWIPDQTGVFGTSTFDFGIANDTFQCRIDSSAYVRVQFQPTEPDYHYNNYFAGALNAEIKNTIAPGIVGGEIETNGSSNNGFLILDGAVIVRGFTLLTGGVLADAYIANNIQVQSGTFQFIPNIGPAALWGPGRLQIGPGSAVTYTPPDGGSFSSIFLLTGATPLTLRGLFQTITTASTYDDAGAWHPSISISVANVDKPIVDGGFGGSLIDPYIQATLSPER